jgi:class 3 adenylate cyclase
MTTAGPDPSWPRLLAELAALGIDASGFEEAYRRGELMAAVRDSLFWDDDAKLTLGEVAERAGVDVETARRARILLGLPDPGAERVCVAGEVDLFRALGAGVALFGEDLTLEFTRVLGQSAAAMAEAAIALFWRGVGAPLQERHAGDVEAIGANTAALLGYLQAVTAVEVVMKLQFGTASDRLAGLADADYGFAIGFVDLVDSTARARTGGGEYGAALRDFDRLAAEITNRHDVRLVKLLGDGAMFVARDARATAAAAVALVAAACAHPRLGAARGGVTFGDVEARDGDYFGSPVNLAARVAAAAPPGAVYADARAAAMLGDEPVAVEARRLKGFDEAVPLYVVPAGPPE